MCILVLCVCACEKPKVAQQASASSTQTSASSTPIRTEGQASPDALLTERDDNRVFLVDADTVTYVVWLAKAPWGYSTWKSGDTYGGVPRVELADVNGDGSLDLFWALQYEENLEGMIVLNRKDHFVKVTPKVADCQLPRLERDNGQYLYIAFVPGAYKLADCRDPVPGSICVERFHGNWPRFYSVIDSTMTEVQPGKDRYLQIATLYRSEAARFDSLYAVDKTLPEARRNLSYCNPDAGNRMRKLADSVERLMAQATP